MRIVINAYSARLGGGQTYLINLLQHLGDFPFQLMIFAPDSLVLPADPRITRMRTDWPTTNPLTRAVWEKVLLPRALKRLKADVLFCPGGVVGTKVPAGCRVVTMFRNMIPFDPAVRQRVPFGLQRLRNVILERVMLRSMANADLVIFISEFAREVIEKRIKVRRAVTIPHGISDRFRSASAVGDGVSPWPVNSYFLYVSRFDVYKHHYELVEAYARLNEQTRSRYQLVLIGESDSECAVQVRQLIAARGLEGRVIIAGAVKYDQLPAVYRGARLTFFSSSCENCPNILLEALAAGRPVLSSSIQPMPEFGGDAVLYYNPRDPADIVARIEQVLSSQSQSDDLGRRAVLRSEKYNWAATARETWLSILGLGNQSETEETTFSMKAMQ